jgi:hypothetical protein
MNRGEQSATFWSSSPAGRESNFIVYRVLIIKLFELTLQHTELVLYVQYDPGVEVIERSIDRETGLARLECSQPRIPHWIATNYKDVRYSDSIASGIDQLPGTEVVTEVSYRAVLSSSCSPTSKAPFSGIISCLSQSLQC